MFCERLFKVLERDSHHCATDQNERKESAEKYCLDPVNVKPNPYSNDFAAKPNNDDSITANIETCTSGVKQSGLHTFELYFRRVIKVQTTYSSGI
ncbi:unnamed protein product [Schistosoma bovis]|nr:unnamed protein product [Schistosoma bovis]